MMGHHHSAGSCGETSSSEDEPSPPHLDHQDSECLALKTDPPDRASIQSFNDTNFDTKCNPTEDGVR
jgi:hypothetical protein